MGLMWNGTVIWAIRSGSALFCILMTWSIAALRKRYQSLWHLSKCEDSFLCSSKTWVESRVTWHSSPDPLLFLDPGGSLQSRGEKVDAFPIWRTLKGKSQLQSHPATAKPSRACAQCPCANRSLISQWVQTSWNARKWGFFLSNPGLEEIFRGVKRNVEGKNRPFFVQDRHLF